MEIPQEKKKYIYPTYICACGGKYNKHAYERHIKTKKHLQFLGEEVELVKLGRPKNLEVNKDCLGYLIQSKVCDLTEEEHTKRKEYIKLKMRESRARKREKNEKDERGE